MAKPAVSTSHRSLLDELEAALPKDVLLNINHISTPPTKCAAIYSAAEGSKPQKTYCESHFLTASIELETKSVNNQSASTVLVYAIEVLIYSTATLTTIFISKADSTGYLHLLNSSLGTVSPIQIISTTFLSFLAQHRRRRGIPLVITLFARAQDQYLFPGSVENSGKHVLDDRGLIRWWCKVLDPVLRTWPGKEQQNDFEKTGRDVPTSQGYLTIPGHDRYETQSIFPASFRVDDLDRKRWYNGHPLNILSTDPRAPPRCLIPHFPDDPKARFLDELDDEISEASERHTAPHAGQWKSVKSMDQFWETMQFRQECSSGRLVGFIWVVLTPDARELNRQEGIQESSESQDIQLAKASVLPTPENSQTQMSIHPSHPVKPAQNSKESDLQSLKPSPIHSATIHQNTAMKSAGSTRSTSQKPKRLTGPIRTRPPRFRSNTEPKDFASIPEQSRFYIWSFGGRGSVMLAEKDYKRVHDLLLKLDFAALDIAQQSTWKWIEEIRLISCSSTRIEIPVRGRLQSQTATPAKQDATTMLVGRKRKSEASSPSTSKVDDPRNNVNTLSAGLVRRKMKNEVPPVDEKDRASTGLNVLGSGLIRKKAKT